jgi:CBS domain containing-hemolysin-like protein
LILPALLILFGAIAGGLRSLLSSPIRGSLLDVLPRQRQEKLEKNLEETSEHLIATAGLVRLACVVATATLLIQHTELLAPTSKWPVWSSAALLAGILLEGIPSMVTRGRGVRIVLWALPVLRLFSIPLRPITILLHATLRFFGADIGQRAQDQLAADLVEVARGQEREQELDESERKMIAHVIELPETDAAEVMTPRTDLTAVPADASIEEALRVSREDGHSRILVYEEDLDHVCGVYYLKDSLELFEKHSNPSELLVKSQMRRPYFVPETMRVPALFEELRRRRTHLAVVVDEYGGTAGVVSMEDLMEEIVGEIEDEHDPEDESLFFEKEAPDTLLVDGRYGIADLNEEFDCNLPEDEDFDTLAGLLFDRFGCIPQPNQTLRLGNLSFQILDVDDRRIRKVRLLKLDEKNSNGSQ